MRTVAPIATMASAPMSSHGSSSSDRLPFQRDPRRPPRPAAARAAMAAHLHALEHLPRPAAGRLRAGSEAREVIREVADHAVAVGQYLGRSGCKL
jgi:hypothetical protein